MPVTAHGYSPVGDPEVGSVTPLPEEDCDRPPPLSTTALKTRDVVAVEWGENGSRVTPRVAVLLVGAALAALCVTSWTPAKLRTVRKESGVSEERGLAMKQEVDQFEPPWCLENASRAVPKLWNYEARGVAPMQVKVLTYNLFWWNLYGWRHGQDGSASKLIANYSRPAAYDLLGFQECEDVWRVLDRAGREGMDGAYEAWHNKEYSTCMAYNKARWAELERGERTVAEDQKGQWYGKRVVQWVRLRRRLPSDGGRGLRDEDHSDGGRGEKKHSKHSDGDRGKHHSDDSRGGTVFFLNHHGPLPINSGGVCGGVATAQNLLRVIADHAKPGDAIIVVGDFNANSASETVIEMERHLYRVYHGVCEDGIDNFFSNVGRSPVEAVRMGSGGSDHEALYATFDVSEGGPAMPPPPPPQQGGLKVDKDTDYLIEDLVHIKTKEDTYLIIEPDGTLNTSVSEFRFEDGFKEVWNDTLTCDVTGKVCRATVAYRSTRGSWLCAPPERQTFSSCEAASNWTTFIRHFDGAGRASLMTLDDRYVTMSSNGTLWADALAPPLAALFRFQGSAWAQTFDYTPTVEMCYTMCHRTPKCEAWTLEADGALPGPGTRRCVLKGGGKTVTKVAKEGFVSGLRVAAPAERAEAAAEKAAEEARRKESEAEEKARRRKAKAEFMARLEKAEAEEEARRKKAEEEAEARRREAEEEARRKDAQKNVLGAERDFLKELMTTVTTTTAGTTTIAPWVLAAAAADRADRARGPAANPTNVTAAAESATDRPSGGLGISGGLRARQVAANATAAAENGTDRRGGRPDAASASSTTPMPAAPQEATNTSGDVWLEERMRMLDSASA